MNPLEKRLYREEKQEIEDKIKMYSKLHSESLDRKSRETLIVLHEEYKNKYGKDYKSR